MNRVQPAADICLFTLAFRSDLRQVFVTMHIAKKRCAVGSELAESQRAKFHFRMPVHCETPGIRILPEP